MKVYLGGAIDEAKDPFGWRKTVAAQLPEGWEAVDPIDLNNGPFKPGDDAQKLVDADLDAIEGCDAFIAMISQASWGTGMEIFYAHGCGIPIIGWNPHPAGRLVGPWLTVHCSLITVNLDEVNRYLQNLLAKA